MNAVVAPLDKTPARIDLLLRKALLDKLARLDNAVLTIVDHLGEFELGSEGADGLRARIDVLDMRFYRQVALGGSIGAAESYMDQDWQADDLCRVIQILVRNRDLLDSMEGGLATLANQLLKVWHFANRNSQQGSKKNIAAHYDLGNALFALFLDQYGMYSSATFYQPELSLEDASTAKLERICRKLHLQADDHVLEIGTGWGGFAAYAAKNYGCRITTTTISREQFEAAQQRISDAGVADRVTVLMEDYRDLQGSYDKLVSIEMIEAVGHHYLDTYLKQCAALLKPSGLALIQAITIEDRYYHQALKSVDFIKRYIFPGSFIPCVSAIVASASRCTDLRLINLEDQGESYALTLNHWRKRFMAALDQVRAQGYNEEFIRMWEFYLCYCEGGFKEKSISNAQLLLAKPGNRRQQWLYLFMNRNNWINMLWMQVLWFGAVIGAAREQLWLAPVVMMGFAFWELRPGRRVYGDFQLMLVAVLIGLILDTTWVRLGWLEFAAGWVFSERAPLWILLLWAGLALTLNHSLAWLQSRLVLAAVLGGVSSPLSYLAAERLGAVDIVTESGVWFIGLGLSWAVALPLLLWLASHFKHLKQEEQTDV